MCASFKKKLTASYIRGAALGLPQSLFGAHFPTAGGHECVLRSASGAEVEGKVMKKVLKEGTGSCRLEVTTGWGRFVKASGLREGDEVQVEYVPDGVLLVTVLSGQDGTQQQQGQQQRRQRQGVKKAGRRGPAGAVAGAGAQQLQGECQQQHGKQQQRKRLRKGDGGVEPPAEPRGRRKAVLQIEQQERHQLEEEEQAATLSDYGPLLLPGEAPYVRHGSEGHETHVARAERAQQGRRTATAGDSSEDEQAAAVVGEAVAAVASQCCGGSGGEEPAAQAGAAAEAQAAARPAKRQRTGAAGRSVHAIAAAAGTALQAGGGGDQRAEQLVAVAQGMVDADVLLRVDAGPGSQAVWVVGHVLEALPGQPGTLRLGPVAHPQVDPSHPLCGLPPPPATVAAADVVVLPAGLQGWRIAKDFYEPRDGSYLGRFAGTIRKVQADDDGNPLYHVRYDDGDKEDLFIQELLLHSARSGQQCLVGPPATSTKRRGRQPKQQQQGEQADEAGAAAQLAAARQQHRQKRQTKLLDDGRQRRDGKLASSRAGGTAPGPGLVQLQLQPAAVAAAQEAGGFYEAGGAGHERGVTAFDRDSNMLRPVGPWIANPSKGTLLARRTKMDQRHLPDRQPVAGRGSAYVPGWLGVRVVDDATWSPDYNGGYQISFYDSHAAVVIRVSSHSWETVEEAAQVYDKVALCYYGDTADTNFPVTAELQAELGCQEEGGSKHVIPMAARLLDLEQSIPDAAIGTEVPQEEWGKWEDSLLEDFMCRRPAVAAPAALAAKLKWLLQQVHPSAILEAYRGDPLRRFYNACDECTEAGNNRDHYAPDAASCTVCALNNKSSDGKHAKHGVTKLAALVREAEAAILSQDALGQLAEGADADAAEAAAQKEQRELDATLQAWREGRSTSGSRPVEEGNSGRGRAAARGRGRGARSSGGVVAAAHRGPQRPPGAHAAPAEPRAGRPAGPRDTHTAPGLKVIVIGAGVSGLKAASDLQRAGAEVTVLEARDRLGGRIHTAELHGGGMARPVDLGATFVCGTDREPPVNPIFEYAADALGLQLRPKKRDGAEATALYDREGRRVPDEVLLAAEDKYGELLEELLMRGESCTSRAVTIGETIGDIMAELELTTAERDILEAYCCDLYVAPTHAMSLKGMVSHGYSGDHELVAGGYKQVVDALCEGRVAVGVPATPLRDVRTSHAVRAVRLLPGGVGVEVEVEGQAEPLWAHAVVCTLPLGCLQKGSVAFDPPLPAYKQDAIAGLGMGTENRVAMLFDEVFWPESAHFLRPVTGRYTYANLHALGVGNVLCAWVRPAEMEAFEAMSDAEVMSDVERSLRQLFPDSYRQPLSYTVTRWSQDPFCYGAYSYVPPNGRKSFFDWLSYPVCGVPKVDDRQKEQGGRRVTPQTRLWFAGEHTSQSDAYTVHGAYTSGRREAIRVAKWWRNNHQEIIRMLEDQRQRGQLGAADGGSDGGGRAAAAAVRVALAAGAQE